MSKLLLAELLTENGRKALTSMADVVNPATGEKLDVTIAAIQAKLEGLSGADVEQLKTELAQLKATFEAFMTGEDNDNGTLDRLKELVAAISENKDSIAALLADKATKAELEAVIARVAALEEMKDYTGIAIGTSAETATNYTGKLKIIFTEITVGEEEEEPEAA